MADPGEDLFGRLAVRKGYVTTAQLDECIAIRACQKIPAPLELILVERGYIDEVALGELLVLVEEHGKEAIEAASSEVEVVEGDDPLQFRQDSLFGRIVVQRGLATQAQVNTCVAEQGKLGKQGKKCRLGKMLVAQGLLTMRQVMDIAEFMRTRLLYCEECATSMELAIEPGKTYACSGCSAQLKTPLAVTSLQAADLFAAAVSESSTGANPPSDQDSDLMELDEDEDAEDESGAESESSARARDRREAAAAKPVGKQGRSTDSGYHPAGEVMEVQPSRPKPIAEKPRTATAPAAPAEPERKPLVVVGKGGGVRALTPTTAPAEVKIWHYAIDRKMHGPVGAEQLAAYYQDHQIDDDTLVWRKGMPEWTAFAKVEEFKALRQVKTAPKPAKPAKSTSETVTGDDPKIKLVRGGDTIYARKPNIKANMPAPKIDGYKIMEAIGKGGMGVVYRALQESMDRVVAIKVMVPKYSEDQEFIDRFTREARASARVNHPNIIQGIDVRQVDGQWCFIMEYADGQRVGDIIRRGGAMSESRALKIATEIASALEHAHRNRIIHRDVKPDNIIITKDGIAKLCDLGLVKVISEDTEGSKVGDLIGTPDYMSPEQASGKADVDHRADIYCLGAAWYHMVTGSAPFPGPNRSVVLMKHLTEELQAPHDRNPLVSPATSSVIVKMMAKRREDRYPSATELLRDLHLLAAGANPSTYQGAPPAQRTANAPAQDRTPPRPPLRRRRRRLR